MNTQKEHRNEPEQYGRGKHPNSKKNLQLWQPGDVPNPNGKPKGATDIKNRLAKMLENISPGSVQNTKEIADFCDGLANITNIDAVNARLLYCAIVLGEAWAVKEVYDRIAGKASQAIDIDLQVNDWKTEAAKYGLSTDDIIRQLRPLIEQSDVDAGDASGD
jgi:phage shock protein PspC (stress-responsive transcriptional regulator)